MAKPATVLSSRAFNQNTAGAKRAAENGPVFITDRGQPAYVLVTYDDYQRLSAAEQPSNPARSLFDALWPKDEQALDFDRPVLASSFLRNIDLE